MTAQILRETLNPIEVPPGCRFHPRCPIAIDACKTTDPELRVHGHRTACILAETS